MKYINLVIFICVINTTFGQWIMHYAISNEPNVCPPNIESYSGTINSEIKMINDRTGYIFGNAIVTPSFRWRSLKKICNYGYFGEYYFCSVAYWRYGYEGLSGPSNFKFLGEDTIFYCRYGQVPLFDAAIYNSIDGGLNSTIIISWTGETCSLIDYHFYKVDSGIISVYNLINSYGSLIRYTNGVLMDTILSELDVVYDDLKVINDSVIFSFRKKTSQTLKALVRSEDSGQSWRTTIDSLSYSIEMKDFKFVTDSIGFITFFDYYSVPHTFVYKTIDQGNTWNPLLIDYNRFQGIFEFLTEDIWYAVQTPDSLFKTYDKGQTWINDGLNINPTWSEIWDIEILSDSIGYVIAGACELYTKTIGVCFISSEISEYSNYFIYPNPVRNELLINNENSNIKEARIIDINGKTIKTIVPVFNSINVTDLSTGIYLIKLIENKKITFYKFIKN